MLSQAESKYQQFVLPGEDFTATVKMAAFGDPVTGGNKWYKLKYNLIAAKEMGFSKILTFGGAYSNHIAATARAGNREGFETLGIIRGEPTALENPTLRRAVKDGMQFVFTGRGHYRLRNHRDFIKELIPDHESWYIIPEGGANKEGIKGCEEILGEQDKDFEIITVCCGTGTTAAGIARSLKHDQKLWGFSVLKGLNFQDTVPELINTNVELISEYHFGGYARSAPELDFFCSEFFRLNRIAIEPVYTGKMFWGIRDMVRKNKIKPGSNLLAIHTGGLQYLL